MDLAPSLGGAFGLTSPAELSSSLSTLHALIYFVLLQLTAVILVRSGAVWSWWDLARSDLGELFRIMVADSRSEEKGPDGIRCCHAILLYFEASMFKKIRSTSLATSWYVLAQSHSQYVGRKSVYWNQLWTTDWIGHGSNWYSAYRLMKEARRPVMCDMCMDKLI
jgi:hypothetical protein